MSRLTENIGDFAYTYSGTQKTNKEYDKWVFEATCKLGQLEDVEELIENMHKYSVCYKLNTGDIVYESYNDESIYYNFKENEIVIYSYGFVASYKVEEYGSTWWLKDKSENNG